MKPKLNGFNQSFKNLNMGQRAGYSLGQLLIGMIISSVALWGSVEFIAATNKKSRMSEIQSLLDQLHLNSMDQIMYYDKSSQSLGRTGLSSALSALADRDPNLKNCLRAMGKNCLSYQNLNPAPLYPPERPNQFNGFIGLKGNLNCVAGRANCVERQATYSFNCTSAKSCTAGEVSLITRYVGSDFRLAPRQNKMSISSIIIAGNRLEIDSNCAQTNLATQLELDAFGKGKLLCGHSWNGGAFANTPNANEIFLGGINPDPLATSPTRTIAVATQAPCTGSQIGVANGSLFESLLGTGAYNCGRKIEWALPCTTVGCGTFSGSTGGGGSTTTGGGATGGGATSGEESIDPVQLGDPLVISFSGVEEKITVPANAMYMRIEAWGAGGGNVRNADGGGRYYGGAGGFAQGMFGVTPGEEFTALVGGTSVWTPESGYSIHRNFFGFGADQEGWWWQTLGSSPPTGADLAYMFNGAAGGGLTGVFMSSAPKPIPSSLPDNEILLIAPGGGGAHSDDRQGVSLQQASGGMPGGWRGRFRHQLGLTICEDLSTDFRGSPAAGWPSGEVVPALSKYYISGQTYQSLSPPLGYKNIYIVGGSGGGYRGGFQHTGYHAPGCGGDFYINTSRLAPVASPMYTETQVLVGGNGAADPTPFYNREPPPGYGLRKVYDPNNEKRRLDLINANPATVDSGGGLAGQYGNHGAIIVTFYGVE